VKRTLAVVGTERTTRVAFVGKGGSGKSTIAGTFARILGRSGQPVLALDSDPMPGMPYSLGVPVEDRPIPDEAVVEGPRGGPRWVLAPGLDAEQMIERHASVCPDGVRYLQFGNLWGHVSAIQRAQHAWSQVVSELDLDRWNLVGDLPGGTRQPMFGWCRYADSVLVVVEPTVKSLHSARRLLNLSKARWAPRNLAVVVNKARNARDAQLIEQRLGVQAIAALPYSPGVTAADRRGRAALDSEPRSGFVDGVKELVSRCRAMTVGPAGGAVSPTGVSGDEANRKDEQAGQRVDRAGRELHPPRGE